MLFLLDQDGNGNEKKNVGIIDGVNNFGLINTCVCILTIENRSKYIHAIYYMDQSTRAIGLKTY